MALVRCRELAGARIRSYRTKCPHCLDEVADVSNAMVASALGRMGLEPLGAPDPRALVKGGTESLHEILRSWNYSPGDATTICDLLEIHAARTLFSARPAVPEGLAA